MHVWNILSIRNTRSYDIWTLSIKAQDSIDKPKRSLKLLAGARTVAKTEGAAGEGGEGLKLEGLSKANNSTSRQS